MYWLMWLLAAAAAFVIGTIPLGFAVVWALAGQDVRRLPAYNLGVQTLVRRIGALTVAIVLAIDVLKGLAAVALGRWLQPAAAPWTVPAVVLGHLYPVYFPFLVHDRETVRSRGVAVMFGAVLGLTVFEQAGLLPVLGAAVVWLVVIALPRVWSTGWGYPSVANVVAGASVPVFFALAGKPGLVWPTIAMALLVLWRHKENLGRAVDGIEVRLGQTRPLPDSVEEISCAFLVHAMTIDDFWQPPRFGWLEPLYRAGLLSERVIRYLSLWVRPMKVDEYVGIETADGRHVTVYILGVPLLADQIVNRPKLAVRRARQAARLARDLGARVLGLGAFWSVVGNKGVDVQEGMDLPITNGGGYTSGTVKLGVERALSLLESRGLKRAETTAAVVGANGVVGLGICRNIADRVGRLIMIGRNGERLERSRKLVARRYKNTMVIGATDYALLPEADIIFTATSSPEAVIFPQHIKPGAIIFDIGRPPDVSPQVAKQVPGVRVIPGGVVRPPGSMRGRLDVHFGQGQVPACLAETIVLALTQGYEHRSLGDGTRSKDVDYLVNEADKLGFEVVDGSDLQDRESTA